MPTPVVLHPPLVIESQTFETREWIAATLPAGVLRYRLLVPSPLDRSHRYPLLICLHGAGERGDDNATQVPYFLPLIRQVAAHAPCYVVIPQVPPDLRWATYGWNAKTDQMQVHPSPVLEATKRLLDHLIVNDCVDLDRIWITGLSMGGYGTWESIQRWPEFFAAAVPICGGGDPRFAARIASMPIWTWHGTDDRVIPIDRSERTISALVHAGAKPIFTPLAGCGHDSWTRAYADPLLASWLVTNRRIRP